MEENAEKDLFCKDCPLQFDTKDAYDSHLSKYHKITNQQEIDDLNSKQEDNSLLLTGSVMANWFF